MKRLKTALFVALLTMSGSKSQTWAQSNSASHQSPSKPAIVFEMNEMEDLSCGESRKAWAAQIKNLQLEDQIAKMEGRPQRNRIAIAKLEGKIDEEDMLRNQEEAVIKEMKILQTETPRIAAAMQQSDKTLLDSIRIARRANVSGSESELKAALVKMTENNEAAQAVAQAAMEKVRQDWQADCEKRGGVFVTSLTGSSCKTKIT